MKIEHRPIETLIPYARNSRTHSPEQIAQLTESIEAFGFTQPVMADAKGIVAGHGRIMAATRIYDAGKTIKLPGGAALPPGTVPVIDCTGWTEAQRRAYIIADNKLALNAGWDEEMLALEFKALNDMGFDLELTGFDLGDIDELLAELDATPEGETDADEAPAVQAEVKTQPGDVWLLGKHRVMCGDSTNAAAVDVLMEGGALDAIVTDPPYGIGIDGQKGSKSKNPKHNRKAHEFMGWDAERPDASVFRYIVNSKVPACIWGGNYFADLLPPSRGWLYWSKGQDGLTMSDGELAWTTQTSPLRCVTVNRSVLQGSVHPTQKPLQVVEFSLEYLKAGPVVLDLFGGSGSTLIACHKTDRQARLMELEPKYCDVIVRRWQQYTGKSAVHAVTGKEFGE